MFNSHLYLLIFLPVTLVVYSFFVKYRLVSASKIWLIVASLFFYASSEPVHLYVLLGSVLLNFFFISLIFGSNPEDIRKRKLVMVSGLLMNILFLGFFKYTNFFLGNLNRLFQTDYRLLNLAFPLAISFFTFTQIAFLMDVYRGKTKKTGFVNYLLYVAFFPNLLSGPIVRPFELMPQIESRRRFTGYSNFSLGLYLLAIGLVKKVVIADQFGDWATAAFDGTSMLNFLYAWAASLSYTFQIYFDFSGYTDMAIGTALMFNFRLPINFNSPYKALDIQDFWRRWHITLSRFLRDYIYIPLGGNRVREYRLLSNLLLTFLIGG
ncbi:MAG TPA: MBOAT family O-acyltransferase, partial [Syntrophorhabdaceae bacterium]|nr:MBOAT family O-acyltransferase [Syntrophorhabdaceae bacterium]